MLLNLLGYSALNGLRHVDDVIESGISYGPYGFRERVREHVKRHVDVIKILSTGGVLSYGDVWDVPQMNLDEVQAVVDEAKKFIDPAHPKDGPFGINAKVIGSVGQGIKQHAPNAFAGVAT